MESEKKMENSRSINIVVSPRMKYDYCFAHLLVLQIRKLRLRIGVMNKGAAIPG